MTSRHTRSPRLRAAAALGAGLLVLAGCSSEKEDASAGTGGGDCLNAEQAQAEYEKAWQAASEQLGVELEPVEEEVCEVDTADWKADPRQGSTYRIAFAAQGPTNSWGLTSEEAFKARADEVGVEVLYASANGDATAQVDNIQQLTSQQPDALVVVPMGEGIAGQVRAAVKQGIPVVACSGVLPADSGVVSTVTRQYDLLGTMYAEWLAQKIGGKGEVAMLSGLAGVPTAEYQAAAAKKAFEKYPDIEVVTQQYTEWSPSVAKTVAANLLAKYPDLAGIWSDSGYGDLGVVQAYTEAGKAVPPLTGDASNAFLKAVKGTDVEFALSSFPPEMSATCLDTALEILAGEPVLNKVYIDSPSFTDADAATYVREECSDNLMIPTSLPQDLLEKLDLC
ncbi:substrate-binding domain-containing protein [Nocardioides sp. BYT-33-1]|uniref:substrate-binding domain-containing protein n=1 Tax=Nocardioides sp. BYT-33-1 TaxID=3416952 RepID=UPI003F530343